ncbi:MAG: hypothetical protein K2O24_05485 [Muribaculaceae bacterium]|nr:hypothetical protein [Muribaculaceae bacterium]
MTYIRIKRMVQECLSLSAIMLLAAMVGACGGKTEKDDDRPKPPADTEALRQAFASGDAMQVAHLSRYPIERPYPLQDIKDSAQMVAYFPIMVDDSLRRVMSGITPADWEDSGWRGWTFGDGSYLWVDEGLYSINYISHAERALRDRLAMEEIQSLAPEMRKGWTPAFCLIGTDDGTLYRVDKNVRDRGAQAAEAAEGTMADLPDQDMADEERTYRLAVYPVGRNLSDMPEQVLIGRMSSEGTALSRVYNFRDSIGDEAEYIADAMSEDDVPVITFRHKGKDVDRPVRKAYWRDYTTRPRRNPQGQASGEAEGRSLKQGETLPAQEEPES